MPVRCEYRTNKKCRREAVTKLQGKAYCNSHLQLMNEKYQYIVNSAEYPERAKTITELYKIKYMKNDLKSILKM